jgi:hypothetical protein
MFDSHVRNNQYKPLPRSSLETNRFQESSTDFEPFDDVEDAYPNGAAVSTGFLSRLCCPCLAAAQSCRKVRRGGRWRRLLLRCMGTVLSVILVLLVLTPIWNPSYSKRPPHYTGSNPRNESVYIAANIVDEKLIRGAWGDAVVGLIERIGSQNVFLSVYENDSGLGTREALLELSRRVKCTSLFQSGVWDSG